MIEKSIMDESQNNESLVIENNKHIRNSNELQGNNVIPEYGQDRQYKNLKSFEKLGSDIMSLAVRIKDTPGDGRSDAFLNLKGVISANGALFKNIQDGKISEDEDFYENYLAVYQAVSAYITSHVGTSDKKSIQTYEDALNIRQMLDRAFRSQLSEDKISKVEGDKQGFESPKNDYIQARTNVERLLKYYRKYCTRVDADLLASDEEKLLRKWDALKTCKKDIEIYLGHKIYKSAGSGEHLSGEAAFLQQEYHSLKTQIMYREMKKGRKDHQMAVSDEGLKEGQLRALSRIDTWVIRNFRNGGYMAVMGDVCDRTDIVGRLLSMSKRQRLYTYMLVEKNERLNPTADGIMESQITYVPDLDKFKDRMIAHKLKFYTRFSGGYIYWEKLTQAMGIATQTQPIFARMEEILGQQSKENNIEEISDNNIIKNDEKKELEEILHMAIRAMELSGENEDIKIDKKKKRDNEREIEEIKNEITQILQKKKAKSSSIKADVQMATATIGAKTVRAVAVQNYVLKDSNVQNWFDLSGNTLDKWIKTYSFAIPGVSAFSSLAGIIFSILALKDNVQSMNGIDATASGLGIANAIYKTGVNTAKIAKAAGTNNAVVKILTSKVSGYASTGVDVIMTGIKGGSYYKGSKNRIKASKLASKMVFKNDTKDDKIFREGMLELNRRLGNRQRTGLIGAMGTTALSATALVLTALSVVTVGVSAFAGALSLGIGAGLSVSDSYDSKSMKMALFDSYFKIPSVYDSEKKEWEKKNNRKLTAEQKIRMRELIRNRIAAKEGYYSPRHAAKGIAGKFAQFLLTKAHDKNNKEEAKVYIAMIKGLGLKYRDDPSKEPLPKESDIVKKLCG